MRRLIGAILLLSAFVVLPAIEVHAQQADKKKKMDAPAAVDSAKLQGGEFVGVLKSVPGTDRQFVLTNEVQKLVPTGKGNVGGNNNANRIIQIQNRIANDQRQMQVARNPQQRQQASRRLQQDYLELQRAMVQMNNGGNKGGVPAGFKVETTKQDIEFQAAESVKVRTMLLSEVFDDKGNVKKYTKEELSQLKGKDKTAVGYESALDKLEAGQKVRLKLSPARKGEKDEDDKRMQVSQIVILEESKGVAQKGKKK